ncbi:HAMP domain-containing histidine kinase [Patescibacteria group bacterium]|nr:HAMP domain-containing histidine kinase [Patescibacteria group bacterium]MBU1877166.1 HAMP domain-containing histidine kinase [Patescibacteria group bacterium]
MKYQSIFRELNIKKQCDKYGVPLWQCPQFLFLIMGIMVIITAIATYYIGTKYIFDPRLVAFIVLIISTILFVIGFIISQSFERLAEANKIKSEFISIVSHQLRTPLSNLGWAIEVLMSGKLGKTDLQQFEYFVILRENIVRMNELIKDLLMVSRIQTQTLFFSKKEFSLVDLVQELIQDFKVIAQASNVRVIFNQSKNIPLIFADQFKIRQVIGNLLDNAIRYTQDKGEIKIKIEVQGNRVYFAIQDNGVGIPKEEQKYIFQRFFRADNVMKYQTQGSGLGLYIAKSIIDKSGGKIGFTSQEGHGSTFWFTAPILKTKV